MQRRQSRSALFSLLLVGILTGTLSVDAQHPAPASGQSEKSTRSEEVKADEPVPVTEKSKPEIKLPAKIVGEDQFGNFRYPALNNKGEVAFLAIFNSPKSPRGYGQSVFIRSADGRWKVIPEGEKAGNLSEPVHGIIVPAFNDNGDLTFVANYGAQEVKSTSTPDPNDPSTQMEAVKKQGLFVKNGRGLKVLVKLGDGVPNMPSSFSMISNPTTNSKNTTAFIGTYVEPDGRGLFLVEDGKLHLIVRSGQKLAAGEEGTFSEHYYPSQINERNEVAFMARVSDKAGIFLARKGGLETIAMSGKPSPIKGANYIGFGSRAPAISQKGEVLYAAFYDGPQAGRGLFVKTPGAADAVVIARSGETIPDTTYTFTDFLAPAINSRGDVVFIGGLGGRNRGVFIKTAKGFEPIAVIDEPVPGGAKDEVFNNFAPPVINDRGEVVFYAGTKSPTMGVSVAIFLRDEKGGLRIIARRGEKMPK